jgi:hypothetical protein
MTTSPRSSRRRPCPTCGAAPDDFVPVLNDFGDVIGWECPRCSPPLDALSVTGALAEAEYLLSPGSDKELPN